MGTVAHAWAKIARTAADGERQHAIMQTQDDRQREADRRERYGRGCDLLKRMGWTITELPLNRMGHYVCLEVL
jgi:hypothetical protein